MLEIIQPSLAAITSALSIIKQGQSLLPDAAETKALQAELETLRAQHERLDSQIAQALGYELCKCTYPPQIMLYKKEQNASVCPDCELAIERTDLLPLKANTF